jgi:hypothetical protein
MTACRLHDEAWRLLDEQPILDASTGWPFAFLNMPLRLLLPAYLDGADRVGAIDPYAGFLVMMHYQGFFNGRFGLDSLLPARTFGPDESALVKGYQSAGDMIRGQLRSRAAERWSLAMGDAHGPEIAHAYRLLQVVDVISLFLCLGPDRTWSLGEGPTTVGGPTRPMTMFPQEGGVHIVDPWPFRESRVSIAIRARHFPAKKYSSSDAIREALSAAPYESVAFELQAG